MQRIHFHKNLAMIGGLLFAALDQPKRAGKPRGHEATPLSRFRGNPHPPGTRPSTGLGW